MVKEICQKCFAENADVWHKWGDEDTIMWENLGMVCCPPNYKAQGFEEGPPEYCNFRLEHMILEGEDTWGYTNAAKL